MADQLRQAQKLEALGRLAGGVAHDFNNILSVVFSCAELLAERLKPEDPMRDELGEIMRAGERAHDLIRELLAFGQQQSLVSTAVDLYEVVVEMELTLRRLVGEDIELVVVPCAPPPWVQVDRGQIDRVVMNLVLNARDAMPTGGKLTIEVTSSQLDEAYASQHAGVRPGAYAMLAISDTGSGMDASTKAHIFEPFFTTKELGRGTGLGLATVFGVVTQSGGHIWVDSEPGKGSAFKIYFPRTDRVREVSADA